MGDRFRESKRKVLCFVCKSPLEALQGDTDKNVPNGSRGEQLYACKNRHVISGQTLDYLFDLWDGSDQS